MRIDINKIRITPKNFNFGFSVYNSADKEISEWLKHWGFREEIIGQYKNYFPSETTRMEDIFEIPFQYEYGDFFSPNLNKHLHLGHLSNFIVAKSLQSLGIAKQTIAILGDTKDGSVSQADALERYFEYCEKYNYRIDSVFYASEQVAPDELMEDGEGEYEGTKIFKIGDDKIVGVKSSGKSTYFYQDIALASKLNAPTLYLTGMEQNLHFYQLKFLFPHIHHIGLGLVTIDKRKMSSSDGEVIMMEDVIEQVENKFPDPKLSWNVLCGHILKYDPASTKDINLSRISEVKTSFGLYLSYTLARLKSAGMKAQKIEGFNSQELQYLLIKSRALIKPNVLFDGLVNHATKINGLYLDHHIKDNEENQKMFQPLLNDLLHGMELLGMFDIERV